MWFIPVLNKVIPCENCAIVGQIGSLKIGFANIKPKFWQATKKQFQLICTYVFIWKTLRCDDDEV